MLCLEHTTSRRRSCRGASASVGPTLARGPRRSGTVEPVPRDRRIATQLVRCSGRCDAEPCVRQFGLPHKQPERPKMTDSDTPVLDTLAAMTAESVARCELDENSLLTARIAALVAVDAPAASYLMHLGPAADAGVTVEQVQDILVAVAPIVGTPRTMSAAAKITTALGIAIVALEAELEAEEEEEL